MQLLATGLSDRLKMRMLTEKLMSLRVVKALTQLLVDLRMCQNFHHGSSIKMQLTSIFVLMRRSMV